MNWLNRLLLTAKKQPATQPHVVDATVIEPGNADIGNADIADVSARIAGGMLKALMIVLAAFIVPVAVVGAGFVINVAFDSVYRLGAVHFAGYVTNETTQAMLIGIAPISAGVTVGTPVLLMLFLWLFHKKISHAAQGIAINFLILWLTIVVLLALYENALTYNMSTAPKEIIGIASFIYAALAGLGLLPLVFVPLVSRIAAKDKYTSAAHAAGAQLGVILEGMALIAGVAAEGFFGMYIGLSPLYVIPAALLIGFGLIRGLTEYSDAKHRKDRFDERAWAAVIVVFAAYLAMVSALSVQELSGDKIHFLSGWLKEAAKDSYAMVQGLFLLSFIATKFLTKRIDRVAADNKPGYTIIEPHKTLGYRLGYAMSHIKYLVADMSKGVSRAQLPAPPERETQQFGRDVRRTEPVNGKDYDATGAFRLAPQRDDPDYNPQPAYPSRKGWSLYRTFETTYRHGDEAYDASFDVKDGDAYLGECGVSICDLLEQSRPAPVYALGVWVFDSADPQFKSQIKVLMTPATMADANRRNKVRIVGESFMAKKDDIIVYECPALQFWVTVRDVGVHSAGFFETVTLSIAVMRNDDLRPKGTAQ